MIDPEVQHEAENAVWRNRIVAFLTAYRMSYKSARFDIHARINLRNQLFKVFDDGPHGTGNPAGREEETK